MTFNIKHSVLETAHLFTLSFGDPASGPEIVKSIEQTVQDLKKLGLGGPMALVNGPVTVPGAFVLAHHLLHLYGCVAVWDPKIQQYIVVAQHGGPQVGSCVNL